MCAESASLDSWSVTTADRVAVVADGAHPSTPTRKLNRDIGGWIVPI